MYHLGKRHTKEHLEIMWKRARSSGFGGGASADSMDGVDAAAGYYRAAVDYTIVSATRGRRFFITDTGYMALGPPDNRVGDDVYVLIGGCTPFILLQTAEKDISTYQTEALS